MANSLSKYQSYVRKTLAEIGGIPNGCRNLKGLGPNWKVWIWEIGPRSKKRVNVLVMADKAMEMGLQVYKINKVPINKTKYSWYRRYAFSMAEELESVNRVTVWCPEESPT